MHTNDRLTRREIVAALIAGTAAPRGAMAADAPFRFGAIDNVALTATDTAASVRFYARVFGNAVLKEKTSQRHYVKVGPNYVAMAPPGPGEVPGTISRFCPGIVNFDLAATRRALDQMHLRYKQTGASLLVPDPDGTLVQLGASDSWNQLGKNTASAKVASEGDPLVHPTGIDHILINVSSLDPSTAFYENILGPIINPASRPRRTWFSGGGGNRIGLALVGPGQKPGIDHYCLTAPFERDSLGKAIESIGGKIIQGDVPAGIDFLDPNGIHVQIVPPNRS